MLCGALEHGVQGVRGQYTIALFNVGLVNARYPTKRKPMVDDMLVHRYLSVERIASFPWC